MLTLSLLLSPSPLFPLLPLCPLNSHLIEPRFDEIKSENEKLASLGQEVASEEVSLKPFRATLGSTPVIAAGGYNADNVDEGLAAGEHDLIAMGRYFCSNADVVDRLRTGKPLHRYSELLPPFLTIIGLY